MEQKQSSTLPISYHFADFSVFPDRQHVEANGIKIDLEPLIFDLLMYFLHNNERIVSRQELVEKVWKQGFVDDNAINRAISTLRKMLSNPSEKKTVIKTHYKKGYSFEPPVSLVFDKHEESNTPQVGETVLTNQNNSDQQRNTGNSIGKKKLGRSVFVYGGFFSVLIVALIILSNMLKPHITETEPPVTTTESSPTQYNVNVSDILFSKGLALFPIASPNKKYIAYSYRPEGESELNVYIKDLETSATTVAVQNDFESFPVAIDNDGNLVYRLLKLEGENVGCEVLLKKSTALKTNVTVSKKLFDCDGSQTIQGQLLDNANTLIYSKTNYRGKATRTAIFSRNLTTGVEYQLSSPSITGNGDQYPSISPDNSQVAFFRDAGAVKGLYISDLEGSNQSMLIEINYLVPSIVWSEDGSKISWLNYKKWEINTLNVASKEVEIIKLSLNHKLNPYVSIAMLSDTRFVFASKYLEHDVVSLNVNTNPPSLSPLVNSFSDELLYLPLSGDGRAVYVESSNVYQIWVKEGDTRSKLTELPTERGVSLALSPSKRQFSVSTSNQTSVYDSETLQLIQKINFENKVKDVDWFDEKTLIMLAETDGVFKVYLFVIDNKTFSLFSDIKANHVQLAGDEFVLIEGLNNNLHVFNRAGEGQLSSPLNDGQSTIWIANGSTLFFKKNVTQLWKKPLKGGKSEMLFDFENVGFIILKMHPDNDDMIITTSKFSGNTIYEVYSD